MKQRFFFLIFIGLLSPLFSHAQNRNLFGVSQDNRLIRIDLNGPVETVIGPITIPNVKGLAHDSLTGITYCITGGGILCSINLSTGEATAIQTLTGGPFNIFGITIDRTISPPKIYIINNTPPTSFLHLDISGPPPFSPVIAGDTMGVFIYGIAIQTTSTSLYALESNNNLLLLNKFNGMIDTPIGPTMQMNVRGLAYDNLSGVFYGTTSTGQLLSFNGSGVATIIDTTLIISHITFVENIPPPPTPTHTTTPTNTATATPTQTPVATSIIIDTLMATPIPVATPIPGIVVPGILPLAPEITLNLTNAKPVVNIMLQAFSGASRNKEHALLYAKTSKISFQYFVEIKSTTDTSGQSIKKSQRDIRKFTTKKNVLTVKNLKNNSNYDVRYRVEITNKVSGSPPKVVGKTLFSPTEKFTID